MSEFEATQILLLRIVQLLEEISAELRILNSYTKKANPGIIVSGE